MLLLDKTTRYRITKINIVQDIVNNFGIPILNTFDNVHTYSKKIFKEKFNNNRAQGIIIEFLANYDSQFDFNAVVKKDHCIVILDSINDPQNLGQICPISFEDVQKEENSHSGEFEEKSN